jgi:hypothetical protein
MTRTALPFRALFLSFLLIMAIIQAASLYAASDVRGRWSGTFNSSHSGVAPFSMTVDINADSKGRIVGSSNLTSHCLKGVKFEVTVTGSTVVLAGSNKAGDTMTVRGSLDNTGTLLKTTYILNGSSSGACETDDGTGTLARQ